MASKLGADSSLLASPVNTKLGCCVALVPLVEEAPAVEAGRNSIQGTATCFPAAPEVLLVIPEVAPGVVLLVPLVDEAPAPLTEMTANSSRPEAGFTIVSLMVPISLPDEPVTCDPVSWLPRTASCPMRPVGLICRLLQPD